MRDYGIVTPAFWIGETGKKLRGDVNAQLLAMYLMTSPHSSMTGVFHCPVIYMAHETGMTFEGASKGLQRLCEVGFCEYDEASECVFVINMASFQIAESLKPGDNRIAGLKKEVAKMAPAVFKYRFIATYSVAFCLEIQPEKTSPSEAPAKPRTGSGARTGSGSEDKTPPRKRSEKASAFIIPDWINAAHWTTWHSCAKRKKATDDQKQMAVDKLDAWRKAGKDYASALENAALGGYQGLFLPDKPDDKFQSTRKPMETFAERDAAAGRKRWEDMTGRIHPGNIPQGEFIDASSKILEIES